MKKKIKLKDIKVSSFITAEKTDPATINAAGGSNNRACPSAYTCVTECFECTGAYCTHPFYCG